MPHPYLRPDEAEHRGPRPERTRGLSVTTAAGRRYFYPGGTPEQAGYLARAALGAELDDPATVREYGEWLYGVWIPDTGK